MKNLILTLIITLPLTLWGQGWEQTYGGTSSIYGYNGKQTQDGGYIVTGSNSGLIFLMKTDENGDELWSKNFENGVGTGVIQDSDGGFLTIGTTWLKSGGNNFQIFLNKSDLNGNEEWTNIIGESEVQEEVNGGLKSNDGYILTGRKYNSTDMDVFLLKTDNSGNELWTKTFGGEGNDSGLSVQQTQDGGYVITGQTKSFGKGELDIYLIKTDENGNEQWSKTFGGIYDEGGWSVQQTTDGGYVITGGIFDGEISYDVYLIKTDGSGNEQWSKTFGGDMSDLGKSVQQTTDEGYIIGGYTYSFGNGGDVYLIKTDVNGNEQWSRTFGGTEIDNGEFVQQTTDGGYFIGGSTNSFGENGYEIYLIKTDDQGNITSTFEIPLPNPNRKLEKTVNIKGQEIKHQTGQPIIEIFDDGTTQKKIIIE